MAASHGEQFTFGKLKRQKAERAFLCRPVSLAKNDASEAVTIPTPMGCIAVYLFPYKRRLDESAFCMPAFGDCLTKSPYIDPAGCLGAGGRKWLLLPVEPRLTQRFARLSPMLLRLRISGMVIHGHGVDELAFCGFFHPFPEGLNPAEYFRSHPGKPPCAWHQGME